MTANVSFDYESTTDFTLTAYATNTSGVVSAVLVYVAIGNIDETPDPNNPPTVSSLAFNVTERHDGYAIGELTGTLTDDYVAEGYYDVQIDVDSDGTIDFEYQSPEDVTALSAYLSLSYGMHEILVSVDEYELETASTLYGTLHLLNVDVVAPDNFAPQIKNLAYTPYVDERGVDPHHFLTGDIVDDTRGNSSYTIEFDLDNDEVVDDSISAENDSTGFTYDYSPSEGLQTASVRVVEYDNNTDQELVGAWATPITFTVAPPVNNPPGIHSAYFYPNTEPESGYTDVTIAGQFNDDFSDGAYVLEVDTNGDGYADDVDIDGDGSPDNEPIYLYVNPFSVTIRLQPGETVWSVRVVESGSGKFSPWIGDKFENHAPVFEQPTKEIKISEHSLFVIGSDPNATNNGYEVIKVKANDQDDRDRVAYFLSQPELKIGKVTIPLPALEIDPNGSITIKNRFTLQRFLKRDAKFEFTVVAIDREGEAAYLQLTIYDDPEYYKTNAILLLTGWEGAATNYVNAVYKNSLAAAEKLKDFIDSEYNDMGLKVTELTNISWAAAAFASTPISGIASLAAVTIGQIISKVIAINHAGDVAIWKQIKQELLAVNLDDIEKIEQTAGKNEKQGERKKISELVAGMAKDPLDQQVIKWRDYINDLTSRLPSTFSGGEKLEAPSVNDIYGELLMRFVHGQGWRVAGALGNLQHNRPFWVSWGPNYLFALDAKDVAGELNSIGYVPAGAYGVIVGPTGIYVTPRN